MKIGIITWFTGSNYGTNLQAIALQYYLRKIGHEVKIINYEVESDVKKRETLVEKIKKQPQKYFNKCIYRIYSSEIKERNEKLEKAILDNCILTHRICSDEEFVKTANEFELLICGGDQIWNPNWYHPFNFANYEKIYVRKISYAPSLGVSNIPEEQRQNIKKSLSDFSHISVREKQSVGILEELLHRTIENVVDPAFLLSEKDWMKIFPCKNDSLQRKEYILSMFLTDNRRHWKACCEFAKRKKMKLVVIPYCGFSYLQRAEIITSADLNDVLDLILNAKYILTDSFHISLFSIIYKKQFYVFQRFKENPCTSTNERIRNLLEITGTNDRYIQYGTNSIIEKQNMDYNKVMEKLQKEIEKSKNFLDKAIQDIN